MVRWMTAFDTTEADVSAFLDAIRETAPRSRWLSQELQLCCFT